MKAGLGNTVDYFLHDSKYEPTNMDDTDFIEFVSGLFKIVDEFYSDSNHTRDEIVEHLLTVKDYTQQILIDSKFIKDIEKEIVITRSGVSYMSSGYYDDLIKLRTVIQKKEKEQR